MLHPILIRLMQVPVFKVFRLYLIYNFKSTYFINQFPYYKWLNVLIFVASDDINGTADHVRNNTSTLQRIKTFAKTNAQEDTSRQSSAPQQQQEAEMPWLVQSHDSISKYRRNGFNIKREGKQSQNRLSPSHTYHTAADNISDLKMKQQQYTENYNLR